MENQVIRPSCIEDLIQSLSIRASVIVPTYRRPELLARCLYALVEQDMQEPYEIIIVDDGASNETRQIVEEWAQQIDGTRNELWGSQVGPYLRYLAMPERKGPAAARNAGWKAARGYIIAFTDDDCIPAPTWLSAGLATFRNGVLGASGRIVVPLPAHPTDYQRNAAELERAEFATANCFYGKRALAATQGFDERFSMAWREDSDLFFRLAQTIHPEDRATCLVRAPDAIVIHPVRPAQWGVSLGQQRKSMFNALLYKKHPAMYRERLRPVTPWHYYGLVGAILMAITAALRGREKVARSAAAAWAVGTAVFCLHRLRHTSHNPRHITEMAATSVMIPPLSIFWRLWGAIKYKVLFV